MSKTLTRAQYAQLLIANYMYIAPWEAQWNTASSVDTSYLQLDVRRKTALLEQDLKAIGIDPKTIVLAEIQTPTNLSEFLGRMYVIEGSTLGGAMIEKQLKLNPNLTGSSFAFYGGYGTDLIPLWKSFLVELNKVTNEAEQDTAIVWAKKCFNDMENCFIQAKSFALHS